MVFHFKTIALINLSVQLFLILLLNYAFLAKKRDLHKHCTIIRISAGIQIVAIVAVMWNRCLVTWKMMHRTYFSTWSC